MKRLLIISLFFLLSCSKSTGIIGTWTVDKINFDFNERKSTPEMIQQLGEIEKHNTLIFKNDSIVHITMAAINADYRYQISDDGTIILTPHDHIISNIKTTANIILTETETPIGTMRITYKNLSDR